MARPDPWPYATPAQPTLVVEDNPEVGRILGPDGKLARIVRAKPDRPAGFVPPSRQPAQRPAPQEADSSSSQGTKRDD